MWQCAACTSKNQANYVFCEICFTEKPVTAAAASTDAPPQLPSYDECIQDLDDAPPAYHESVPDVPQVEPEFMEEEEVQPNDEWSDEDDEVADLDADMDGWSSCEEQPDDFVPEKTLEDIGWQCVKCSQKNTKYSKVCSICSESRNPMMWCDICSCEVPYLCFEDHQKAHEKNGQQSPVSVAFKLIENLRNYSELPSCVCWDFAKDFVQKYREFLKMGYTDPPMIIYHWTAAENFNSIIDGNLKVPGVNPHGGNNVRVVNGSALGVGIYSHTDPHWGRSYGRGASKMFMCLALKGKTSTQHGNTRQGIKDPFDTTVSGQVYVFYSQEQVLPIYNINPDDAKRVIPLAKQLIQELRITLKETMCMFENHDPYKNAPSKYKSNNRRRMFH